MKKILLILGVIVLGYCIYLIKNIPPKTKVWTNNDVSASFPQGTLSEPSGPMPTTAEIYIDASGSMKPYFTTDDTNMVNTISEINNLNPDGTGIYFLDNPKKYTGLVKNTLGDLKNQPNLTSTTFHSYFAKVASMIDTTNTITYLVTDGIMSVDGGNTSKALVQLRGLITNSLRNHPDLAGGILRYTGDYNGYYWDCRNKSTPEEIHQMRPYYVVVIGRKNAVKWLSELPAAKLNNPESALYFGIHDFKGHNKAVLSLGDSARIENMSDTVKLILDLPPCLNGIDPASVKLFNNDRNIGIPIRKEGTSLIAKIPPTTPLVNNSGYVNISMIAENVVPGNWETWNNEDDTSGPDEVSTYGLKYLINGLKDGLEPEEQLFVVNYQYKLQ